MSDTMCDELKPWADDVPLVDHNAPKNNGHLKYLIEYLLTVYKRFGDTTVTIDLQWGATAMHKRDALQEENAALRAKLEACERDAERYRWLRERYSGADMKYKDFGEGQTGRPVAIFSVNDPWPFSFDCEVGAELLDAAIDAAIDAARRA